MGVFGLVIENPRLAVLTRRVLLLASLSASLSFLSMVLHVMIHKVPGLTWIDMLLAIVIAIAVPCCGYWGARNNDENMVCCFCCCNLFSSCLSITVMVVLVVAYVYLDRLVGECAPSSAAAWCPHVSDWHIYCPLKHSYTVEECYSYIAENLSMFRAFTIAAVVIRGPAVILQCLSFVWGRELYKVLKKGEVIHCVPACPAMRAHTVQPRT